jgi:hypothetical protein
MSRLRIGMAMLALACVSVGLSAGALAATPATHTGKSLSFTLRGGQFRVQNHRLTYMVTICTPARSVLNVRATFAPARRSRGVITLTPGTTQYQDHGCWPAFVSAAIARTETRHCKPLDCPAIRGHRYRSTVTVTFANSHETKRAPRLLALA